MPLFELSADEAVANRKGNPFATWGERSAANRVEPIAKPTFDVPFKLRPGESIFTVGSCFARNVETHLLQRGFRTPVRDLFTRPEFLGLDVSIVNNFGTPSIYNEFAWAFDERPFDPAQHIVEVQAGKFSDLHLISSVRPDSYDLVLARRRAVREAYRTAKDSRVIIMTLGLVEIWYDTKTATYVNSAPKPTLIRNEPNRFKMHVLSYEETYKFLEDALMILRKHGRADLQVIMTVSPVPLMLTHRAQDVMVANTYSKSVLRAVAEAIVARHPFVTYFPSYESVVLSDRKLAWRDDFVHVTPDIVAVNVGRMVDAFVVDTTAPLLEEHPDTLAGSEFLAVERAHQARLGPQDKALEFFRQFGALSHQSLEFAVEHAQFLLTTKDYHGALDVLVNVPERSRNDVKVLMMLADALAGLGRNAEAYALLDAQARTGMRSNSAWLRLLKTAFALDDPELVLGVLARWNTTNPNQTGRATTLVGRYFFERGDVERAISFLQSAVSLNAQDSLARIYLAEAQLAYGHRDMARSTLATINPSTPSDIKRTERLKSLLAS